MQVAIILITLILAVVIAAGVYIFNSYLIQSKKKQKENDLLNQSNIKNKNKPVQCYILYGTQTGTAQRFSQALGQQLQDLYSSIMNIKIDNMEKVEEIEVLKQYNLVFFLVATYGDGEPTDDTANFHNQLVEYVSDIDNGTKEAMFQGIKYGVFGLGNRQYEHYNAEGRILYKHMKTMGAEAVSERGEGDDDEDIQQDYENWIEQLSKDLPKALSQYIPQEKTEQSQHRNIRRTFSLDLNQYYEVEYSDMQGKEDIYEDGDLYNNKKPVKGLILETKDLYKSTAGRYCVQVKIKLPQDKLQKVPCYETGDHIGVYPFNQIDLVERFANRLGVSLDKTIQLRKPAYMNGSNILPPNIDINEPVTVRAALQQMVELTSSPTRSSLKAIAYFANNENQRNRLLDMANPKNHQAYKEYITRPKRTIIEILEEFDSVKLPLGVYFGHVAQPLQPRLYSISSGALRHPREIHITVAVIEEQTGTGRVHKGAASKYLQLTKAGQYVAVYLRHSTFRMPKQLSSPVIMIGPGTGIAPYIGFLSDYEYLHEKGQLSLDQKLCWLYFGCRNPKDDFMYESMLKKWEEDKVLDKLRVAFSRITDRKIYVQNLLQEDSQEIFKVLNEQQGYLYICGDKVMSQDVQRVLTEAALDHNIQNPEKWIEDLTVKGRYQKDVW